MCQLHIWGHCINDFLKLFCIQLSISFLTEYNFLSYCHNKFVSFQDSFHLDIEFVSLSQLFHLVLQHLDFLSSILHDTQICGGSKFYCHEYSHFVYFSFLIDLHWAAYVLLLFLQVARAPKMCLYSTPLSTPRVGGPKWFCCLLSFVVWDKLKNNLMKSTRYTQNN